MPILREGELDIISHSAEQTIRFGVRLGRLLEPGDIVCLSGDMGTGKTVFSLGVGRGWGTKLPLSSPTFNLVHLHKRDSDDETLYHMDCYRLSGTEEVDTIGLDDILDTNGVVLVEWAERIQDALPEERLWVDLRVIESTTRRNFRLEAIGERYHALLEAFREAAFGS